MRGKQGKSVELGAKLGLTKHEMGSWKKDNLSWNSYRESENLILQAEAYKALFGYYPELILADKIYATNKNRNWCKENSLSDDSCHYWKTCEEISIYQKAISMEDYAERNGTEGNNRQCQTSLLAH